MDDSITYRPEIITASLADLDGRAANLRAANDEVTTSSNNLLAIWEGEAAEAFRVAKAQWDGEFQNLAQMLSTLVRVSHESMDSALAADASSAAGFGG
ncbi:WXG100 family type VII secretion target [Nocardia sp. BMG51109]|uniref:WXG100 family type VII secretion target n=1 Tax=Nocardia sp. BMG51109 TaxID=1056816 RepID=UPI000462F170|nr:WXG100 family type VII secretion target [Nocardia sp. BMG51109]